MTHLNALYSSSMEIEEDIDNSDRINFSLMQDDDDIFGKYIFLCKFLKHLAEKFGIEVKEQINDDYLSDLLQKTIYDFTRFKHILTDEEISKIIESESWTEKFFKYQIDFFFSEVYEKRNNILGNKASGLLEEMFHS